MITEALVHGWDLARATDQPAAFPLDVTERSLSFSQRALAEVPREGRYGMRRPVAAEAPSIDKLAAFLGRLPD